jgi:YegS/Rv2252/BmrU family lipid kinase
VQDRIARVSFDATTVRRRLVQAVDILASREGTRPAVSPIRRALLIVNPGSRRGARLHAEATAAFDAEGVECETILTEAAGHGARVVTRMAAAYDAVFTLGGDGTAVEIVAALARSGRPVGILPGGTGNLLARTLGIPLRVDAAVPALLRGDRAEIDLGVLADGRLFAFSAGIGIDVRMIEGAPARLKRRLGVLAYALSAARAVIRRDEFMVRATVDGTLHQRKASAVMVANFGAVLNDLIRLGPGIRSDDGLLDLCIFSPSTLRDAVRVMWRLVRKDFRTDPCMLYAPGRTFHIETDPARAAQSDGELIGSTPLDITVAPRAALMLIPRRN